MRRFASTLTVKLLRDLWRLRAQSVAIALVIAVAFFDANSWVTLGIFAAEQLVFLWILNGSIGHLILRMRVVPVVPARLGLWRPVVRTLLLCLAIPPLIFDRDQRGLHDRLAGTILVRV